MDKTTLGWINGFIGILIFSASLPATRIAVLALDPIFMTSARAAIAGIIGGLLLVLFRARRPERIDALPLVVTAFGVVVGFPLLTALALKQMTSAHSIVFTGLLPLSTAIFGVLRGNERPRTSFWMFSCLGSACVVAHALAQAGEATLLGDLMMLAAIIVCGLGYAEGAVLSRRLGGWQVICWALVVSLPVTVVATASLWPANAASVTLHAWGALGYVSLFSMLIGFFFWYRGLALGGIASVGQLQLLQPFFGFGLAALLLGEQVSPLMLVATLGVVACVAGARHYARR
jgi:drug/metabolite transporter (DMT)-like permease